MATYAALNCLKRKISRTLNYMDVLLVPLARETYELVFKALESFQFFLERLEGRRRKMINSSSGPAFKAIRKFDEILPDVKMGENIFTEYKDESERDVFMEDVHNTAQGARALIETLKSVKEEYSLIQQDVEDVVSKSKMVGLWDQWKRLKEDILDPKIPSNIFAIVGMAGLGKTTLAREVFEDLDFLEWFECRAWVTLGNYDSNIAQISMNILAQVDFEAYKRIIGGHEEKEIGGVLTIRLKEEEIREVLKVSLKGKRYLIVLDDIWDEKIKDFVVSSFPDNQNGSLLLLTTRMKYIALHVRSQFCYVFEMRLLNEKESWELLCEEVFGGASCCPPQLVKAGKKIAKKCDGLPLTIVKVAELLSKSEEPSESLWMDVAEKRLHQIFVDAYDQISEVLYPNYGRLSADVKLCFLYMGVFSLKYEIPKTRLINLWFAEEFIDPYMDLTLENCAINTLYYLDLNCIIMVYQRSTSCIVPLRYGANVKSCGLHSSWWYFCLKEARETNFFYALDCLQDGLEEGIKNQSRLSVHTNVLFALKDVYNSMEENCSTSARSLLCLGPYSPYMVPICFGLKLLERLDALNIRFYDFPLEVIELVELRYLSLTCNDNLLPPSISKLQKLQYLIVQPDLSIKTRGALPDLPMEIWDMKKLQHLQVRGVDLPDLGETSLQNLITLSDVTPCSLKLLKRVPNLKKLGVRVELEPNVAQPLVCFSHTSHLHNLKSFKCVIVNPEYKVEVVSPVASISCLPCSLTKLSFNGLGYPWEEMIEIASLPNLQVLKLQCNSFQGPMWKVEENEFPMLKCLLMEDVDLTELVWARGSFKSLEALRIKHCYKLKKLHLGDLQKVWEIEVVDSNPMVEWHVKFTALTEVDVKRLSVHSSWKS